MKYLRYYSDFFDNLGHAWRVEILQDADAAYTPEEVTLSDDPLQIEWHEIEKQDSILSSAATLTLNSDTDRQFIDIFQVEVGKVRLDVYREEVLYWSGTLDTELYEEPFSDLKNYDVTLTFSDFAILERVSWGKTGFITLREILTTCLAATNISDTVSAQIVEYISTSRDGVTSAQLLDSDTVVCDNFYDEDGKAMSTKEVLEGMLKPYNLHIVQKGGKIYLFDLNALNSLTAKQIVWDSDDAMLGVDKIYNKVKISFSPYAITDVIAPKIKEKTFAKSGSDEIVKLDWDNNTASGTDGFKLEIGTAGGLNLFSSTAHLAAIYRITPLYSGDESMGVATTIRVATLGGTTSADYFDVLGRPWHDIGLELFNCPQKPYISRSAVNSKNQLKLTMDLMYDARFNPFEQASLKNEKGHNEDFQKYIEYLWVPIKLILRDTNGTAIYHYENKQTISNANYRGTRGWIAGDAAWGDAWLAWYQAGDAGGATSGFTSNKRCIGGGKGNLPTAFQKIIDGELIDFPPVEGWLELHIGQGQIFNQHALGETGFNLLKECNWCLYKMPKIEVVDQYGKSLETEDINISAWINKSAKEELEIDTIFGTTRKDITLARGFIMNTADKSINETYTRAGKAGTLEKLLIGTMYSQFARRHCKLSGTALLNPEFCIFSDANQSGKFVMLGETQDIADASTSVTMCELSEDSYEGLEYTTDDDDE